MIARPRKATMPMWRSAARTTARGVPLRFSILRARLRLAHQADLGDARFLEDREDGIHLAVAHALVASDQDLEVRIGVVERRDLRLELVGADRLAFRAVGGEVDLA